MNTHMNQNTRETPATRLRNAREEMGLSRSTLADRVGFSAKTIEHYEAGRSEPPISRLKALADALDITTNFVMNGKQQTSPSAPIPISSAMGWQDEGDKLRNVLTRISAVVRMRSADNTRKIEALIGEAKKLFTFLTYAELMTLAEEKALMDIPQLRERLEEAQKIAHESDDDIEIEDASNMVLALTNELTERVLDVSFFDADLYRQDFEYLDSFAEKHGISPDRFLAFGWRGIEEVAPSIRNKMREYALKGVDPFKLSLDGENEN